MLLNRSKQRSKDDAVKYESRKDQDTAPPSDPLDQVLNERSHNKCTDPCFRVSWVPARRRKDKRRRRERK